MNTLPNLGRSTRHPCQAGDGVIEVQRVLHRLDVRLQLPANKQAHADRHTTTTTHTHTHTHTYVSQPQ